LGLPHCSSTVIDNIIGGPNAIRMCFVVRKPRRKPIEPQFRERGGRLQRQSEPDAPKFRGCRIYDPPGGPVWCGLYYLQGAVAPTDFGSGAERYICDEVCSEDNRKRFGKPLNHKKPDNHNHSSVGRWEWNRGTVD